MDLLRPAQEELIGISRRSTKGQAHPKFQFGPDRRPASASAQYEEPVQPQYELGSTGLSQVGEGPSICGTVSPRRMGELDSPENGTRLHRDQTFDRDHLGTAVACALG